MRGLFQVSQGENNSKLTCLPQNIIAKAVYFAM